MMIRVKRVSLHTDTAGGGSTSWNGSDMMTWVRSTNSRGVAEANRVVTGEPLGEAVDVMTVNGLTIIVTMYYYCYFWWVYQVTCLFVTISGGVSKSDSDKITPDRAWTFQRGSLFELVRVCNRCRRTRGSRCARFELNQASWREDMYNIRGTWTFHYW